MVMKMTKKRRKLAKLADEREKCSTKERFQRNQTTEQL